MAGTQQESTLWAWKARHCSGDAAHANIDYSDGDQESVIDLMLVGVVKVCLKHRKNNVPHEIHCNLTSFQSVDFLPFLQADLMGGAYLHLCGRVAEQVTV